jgi:Mrp family chromosome partitioning ATPase
LLEVGRISTVTIDADKPTAASKRLSAIPHVSTWWRDRLERWLRPRSRGLRRASRSYRYLARQIEADLPYADRARTILVSSPAPLDLSNATLLMFAYFMRDELGCRILLVDGTLREGGVGARLGFGGTPGFLDLLYGNRSSVRELIRLTQRRGISVLPAGRTPTDQLLPIHSSKVCEILREAQTDFDYVLFQQASILDDSRYLRCTEGADLILLLIEEGVTLMDELDRCKKVFRDHQISNVQLMLSTPT